MTSQSNRSERSVIENKVKAPTEESCVIPTAMSASCKGVTLTKTISANESLKTMKEPELLKTMKEPELSKTIKEPESLKTIKEPEFSKTIKEPESLKTIKEPELSKTIKEPESLKTIKEPEFSKTIKEPELLKTMKEPELLKTMKEPESLKTIKEPELSKTMKEPEFSKTIKEPELLKTMKEPELLKTMKEPELLKTMKEPESLKTIKEPELSKTMKEPQSLKTMKEPDDLKTVKESGSIFVAAATKPELSNEEKSIDSSIPPLPVVTKQSTKIPILDPVAVGSSKPVNVAVPKKLSSPARIGGKLLDVNQRPLVLTTHLVPSLPIGLFEIIAEIIEMATDKPVVLLHESRSDRPVPENIVDIAILPISAEWKTGVLLPIGMVFAHRLNIHKTPGVYADIIVTKEIAQNVEDIMDLRGHSCAIADRHKQVGTAGLFFSYLKSKGENPSFFGNNLDSDTQVAALQMVAGKQAEVGVLEAPVINCHKHTLPGVNSLFILDSLGPLPPYQIMVNAKLPTKQREQIEQYLLKVQYLDEWIAKLKPYGMLGFDAYSADNYDVEEIKSVVTSVRYY